VTPNQSVPRAIVFEARGPEMRAVRSMVFGLAVSVAPVCVTSRAYDEGPILMGRSADQIHINRSVTSSWDIR